MESGFSTGIKDAKVYMVTFVCAVCLLDLANPQEVLSFKRQQVVVGSRAPGGSIAVSESGYTIRHASTAHDPNSLPPNSNVYDG
jgi:hypothetical protein